MNITTTNSDKTRWRKLTCSVWGNMKNQIKEGMWALTEVTKVCACVRACALVSVYPSVLREPVLILLGRVHSPLTSHPTAREPEIVHSFRARERTVAHQEVKGKAKERAIDCRGFSRSPRYSRACVCLYLRGWQIKQKNWNESERWGLLAPYIHTNNSGSILIWLYLRDGVALWLSWCLLS